MIRILKQLLIYFSIPLLIIGCQLLGKIWPVFNGIAFVLFWLVIAGILGLLFAMGIKRIFKKKKCF
jgi:hypothetical protein